MPPTVPPMPQKPCAIARYFNGRISEGIACTMDIVARVDPIMMPPPISMFMDVALAEMMAPTKAIRGGMAARYLRFETSERRPMMGERTDCMSRGP